MNIITLFVLIAFVALMLCLFQWLGRYLTSYRFTDNGLRIVSIFTLILVPYEEIIDIEIVPPQEAWKLIFSFNILRLGNRLWGTGVLIKKTRGVVRTLIISPNRPEEFVTEVRKRMSVKNIEMTWK